MSPLSEDPRLDETFGPAFLRLQEEAGRYFPGARVRFQPIQEVKAIYSWILRVQVQDGTRPQDIFIKKIAPEEDTPESLRAARELLGREFQALVRLHEKMSGYPGLTVSRPIAFFPEEIAMITEAAPGMPLRQMLRALRPWQVESALSGLLPAFERMGAWLRAFQNSTATGRHISLPDQRSRLEKRLQAMTGQYGRSFGESGARAVLTYFDRLSAAAPLEQLVEVETHNDFCPENVLIDGTDITVLDCDGVENGAVYADLSHMYMHVENLRAKPWISGRAVQSLEDALLRGFDPALRSDWPMFQWSLVVNVVYHFADPYLGTLSRLASARHQYVWRRHWHWLEALADRSINAGDAAAAPRDGQAPGEIVSRAS